MKVIKMSCGALAAALCLSSFAADGIYVYSGENTTWHKNGRWWQCWQAPSDGGIAYLLSGNSEKNISQTLPEGFRLGGIVALNPLSQTFTGSYPLIFTGEPVISNIKGTFKFTDASLEVDDDTVLKIDCVREESVDNGVVELEGSSFGGAGTVEVAGGLVRQTGTASAVCVTTNDVRMTGGFIEISPGASDADVSQSMATAAGAKVTIDGAGGGISMSQDGTGSISLAMGGLAREGRATLTVEADASALGDSQRYTFASPPASVNGMMPAYMAYFGSDRKYDLLAYNADSGLVPVTWSDSLSAGASAPVALDANGTQNDASGSVAALKLDLASGSFVNNGDIVVGNGTAPAALVCNWSAEAEIGGTGSIDFGSSEGVIWLGSGMQTRGAARTLTITNSLRGSNGLTLAGRMPSYLPHVRFGSEDNDFSGPLHVQGCRLWIDDPACIPADVSVHVDGSMSRRNGQLYLDYAGTFTNDMRLSGYGAGADGDGAGALIVAENMLLAGDVTLEGDTFIGIEGKTALFEGPISGEGDLAVVSSSGAAGVCRLSGTNTWKGALDVGNACTVALVHNGATFGTGDVRISGESSKLDFSSADGITVTNAISGNGSFVAASNAVFSSVVQCRNASAPHGASFSVSAFTAGTFPFACGVEIGSAAGGSVFTLGTSSGEHEFSGTLKDGDGVMSFVKTGDSTLVLRGAQTYSGSTTVAGGTLKLESRELPVETGLSWWLDADAVDTMLFAADGVTVTNWASRLGSFSFGPAGVVPVDDSMPDEYDSFSGTEWGCPRLEDCSWAPGHKVVRFGTNNLDRLYATSASGSAKHRTVFFVTRAVDYWNKFGGLFGRADSDYGIRLRMCDSSRDQGGWSGTSNEINFFDSDGNFRIDGTLGTVFTWSKPQILVSQQDKHDDSDHRVRFRPALGGYLETNYTNPFRPYGGEIAEVVAYDRILSEEEIKKVEDYLARKWYGSAIHGTDPSPADVLPATTALSITTGGTLDLNGVSATVASLDGIGAITNSGSAAVLTVTGASTFSGTVSGDVTLALAGGATGALKFDGDASLRSSGATRISAYNPAPPQDGLLYWLDASKYDTFTFAEDGVTVTNWASRVPGLATFEGPVNGIELPPFYDASGMNGKPAVYFGKNDTETTLFANSNCATRTLFIVARGGATAETSSDGIWSPYNTRDDDLGVRFNNTRNTLLRYCGGAMYFNFGDHIRVNGVVSGPTEQGRTVSTAEPFVFSAVYGDWHGKAPSGRNSIGGYYFTHANGPRGMNGWIAEVIAYNRALTPEEITEVELYLTAKWQDSEAIPAENTSIWAGDGELTLVATASSDKTVVPAVWYGDLDISGVNLVVDGYDHLSDGVRRTVLTVEGETTGSSFKSCDPEGSRWRWTKNGASWTLLYSAGTCVIIR